MCRRREPVAARFVTFGHRGAMGNDFYGFRTRRNGFKKQRLATWSRGRQLAAVTLVLLRASAAR